MRDFIQKVAAGRDLSIAEATAAMDTIVAGSATPAQVGAFMTALRIKGEATTEIVGCAQKLAERFTPLDLGIRPEGIVEMSGTGGDRPHIFPVAIASALVAAASGVKVVQQAAHAPGGAIGKAEVLSALGVNVSAPLFTLRRCMTELGIAFISEDSYGDAFSWVEAPRIELGFRTIFHLLRAVVSPVGSRRQVIGVYSEKVVDTVANVMKKLGTQHAIVATGLDGLDQITSSGKSKVAEVHAGQVDVQYLQPETYALKRGVPSAYTARTPQEGAMILNGVLSGQQGPARDVVVLNAAAAIRVGGFASSFDKAVEVAKRSLASGRPKEILERLIKISLV